MMELLRAVVGAAAYVVRWCYEGRAEAAYVHRWRRDATHVAFEERHRQRLFITVVFYVSFLFNLAVHTFIS